MLGNVLGAAPGPEPAHPERPWSSRARAHVLPPRGTPVHRLVPSPAGRLHLVEQGSGPLVLLVHGFPEGWYSWRHQLPALAAAGYRAVAVDVRGYGRSSRPAATDAFRMRELVADAVAVVDALGERTAVVVGHDWGSAVAANAALIRPDVFRAVAMLSVPYAPRGGPKPSTVFASVGGDEEFYVSYFQEPGRAEAEIEPDVRGWLAGFYAALSGDTMPGPGAPPPYFVGPGGTLRECFPAGRLPAWLDETDLDVFAGEFERTGTRGRWPATATWTGTGRTSRSTTALRSPSRPCSSAGASTRPPRGWPTPSRPSPHVARPGLVPHPRRLRSLAAAGAARGDQPPPDGLARGPAPGRVLGSGTTASA